MTFGGETFLDGVTLSHAEFYDRLTSGDILPTTSQIPPAQFADAFEQVTADGDTVIVVTLSSKFSGTYQSASIAASDFPDKVFVVDSYNLSLGQWALIEYGVRLMHDGLDAPHIVNKLNDAKGRLHTIALLDTLEYLKRGGRISKTVAFAGGLLSIKPVVAVRDGAVELVGKARGSKQGNTCLTDEIEKCGGVDFSMPIRLGYTGNDDTLLQNYIADSTIQWKNHLESLPIMTVGGAIGTHIGPGAIAVSFFEK